MRSQILRTCSERGFDVLANVVMPDHVHLLLQGLHDSANFKTCMTVARQRSAHAFRQGFHERLWQEGYHDRVLRNPDEAGGVVRYIVENPVRAGLCTYPEDYPYTYVARSFSSAS
jgi:REP element-mobilizing transposase RayT